jgi:hypothetical protein
LIRIQNHLYGNMASPIKDPFICQSFCFVLPLREIPRGLSIPFFRLWDEKHPNLKVFWLVSYWNWFQSWPLSWLNGF